MLRQVAEGVLTHQSQLLQRIGPSAKGGWEWVAGVHDWQAQQLAGKPGQATTAVD